MSKTISFKLKVVMVLFTMALLSSCALLGTPKNRDAVLVSKGIKKIAFYLPASIEEVRQTIETSKGKETIDLGEGVHLGIIFFFEGAENIRLELLRFEKQTDADVLITPKFNGQMKEITKTVKDNIDLGIMKMESEPTQKQFRIVDYSFEVEIPGENKKQTFTVSTECQAGILWTKWANTKQALDTLFGLSTFSAFLATR